MHIIHSFYVVIPVDLWINNLIVSKNNENAYKIESYPQRLNFQIVHCFSCPDFLLAALSAILNSCWYVTSCILESFGLPLNAFFLSIVTILSR